MKTDAEAVQKRCSFSGQGRAGAVEHTDLVGRGIRHDAICRAVEMAEFISVRLENPAMPRREKRSEFTG